jgi:hypothetical protein
MILSQELLDSLAIEAYKSQPFILREVAGTTRIYGFTTSLKQKINVINNSNSCTVEVGGKIKNLPSFFNNVIMILPNESKKGFQRIVQVNSTVQDYENFRFINGANININNIENITNNLNNIESSYTKSTINPYSGLVNMEFRKRIGGPICDNIVYKKASVMNVVPLPKTVPTATSKIQQTKSSSNRFVPQKQQIIQKPIEEPIDNYDEFLNSLYGNLTGGNLTEENLTGGNLSGGNSTGNYSKPYPPSGPSTSQLTTPQNYSKPPSGPFTSQLATPQKMGISTTNFLKELSSMNSLNEKLNNIYDLLNQQKVDTNLTFISMKLIKIKPTNVTNIQNGEGKYLYDGQGNLYIDLPFGTIYKNSNLKLTKYTDSYLLENNGNQTTVNTTNATLAIIAYFGYNEENYENYF